MFSSALGRQAARFGAIVTLAGLALTGCGNSGNDSSSSGGSGGPSPSGGGSVTATKNDTIAAAVPASIRSKGKIVVAADATYAPNEFVGPDGSTVQGMDADLAAALGQVTGLTVEVQNVKFDNIIPGITGGKYDMGASSFTDTKEREKTVDFVTYFSAGTSFFVRANSAPVGTLDDLCGKKVSVETGTTQETDAKAQKTKCTAAGKADVTVLSFPDQNATNLALQSSRADVSMADSPVAAYQVKQSNGAFMLSGQSYGTAPYGLALPKGNGMSKVVLDALNELVKQGVYARILDKWGVSAGAITNFGVNQAVS